MKAIGTFGERFDFVIDSFQPATGDRMPGVGPYPRGVGAKRLGHFHQLADGGLVGLLAPIFQAGFPLLAGGLAPEFAQFFFQVPAQQKRLIY